MADGAKPWERYQKASQSPQEARGPWTRYTPTGQGGDGPVGAYRAFLDDALSRPEYDTFLTRLESGGKADAKAPTSSATGLHQFTGETWLKVVGRAKPAWAEGLDKEQILALRTDPEKSTEMEKLLREEHAAALFKAKAPLTNVNLYAAHHFGATKGVKFAQADDDTPMAAILSPDQMQANRYLAGMTKKDAINNWLTRGTDGPWNQYKKKRG